MKYSFKDNVKVLSKYNKFLFLNPKEGKWLRIGSKVKEMIDNVIEGNEQNDIINDKEKVILDRFIKAGILESDKIQQQNSGDCSIDINDIGTMYFTITRKCNLSCSFCSLSCSPNVDEPLAINIFKMKAIIDELSNYKVGAIIITGGEPTLRDDLFEIIDYIHEKLDCKLILETNGLLLDSNLIANLKGKLHHIDISFENIFEENSEWQYEKIIQVVQKLKENNIPMLFSYVMTSENWSNIFKFMDLVTEYDPKHIVVRTVAPIGKAKGNNNLMFKDKEILKIYKGIYKYIYEKGYNATCIQEFATTSLIPRYNCSAKENTLFVDADGNAYSCPSLFYSEFCYGNIVRDGVNKIIENKSKKVKSNFYKECFHIDERPICKDCEVKYFCGGSCFAEIYANKDKIGTIPIDCEFRKILIEYNLWQYDSKLSFLENLENVIEKLTI